MENGMLKRAVGIGLALSLALSALGGCAAPAASSSGSTGDGSAVPAGNFDSVEQEPQPPAAWETIPIVAHAMGTVDGRRETNSLDAFLASYEAGQRIFEVDLQLTSDGVLVARHDWDQISYYNLEQTYVGVMDHETFMNTPICYYYNPVDIDGLLALLISHPDAYLVTDSKDTDETTVRAQLKAITRAVERTGDPSLWDRIIVQIYHEEMLDWVREETSVTNFIFTLYQVPNPDYEAIGTFCRNNGIRVVTMDSSRLSGENSEILHKYGCLIYLHTVNRLSNMVAASWGADGFYSDYITPDQLQTVLDGENQPYLYLPPEP